jgi:hypothetical protein
MEDLIKEFKLEIEAIKRSQNAYKKINEMRMDNYLKKLLSDGNPYAKKLLKMSSKGLEKAYIKKSEEIAKLPEPPTEFREKTVKKGYLITQLYLIGAMLRKRKIKQELRKNQEKKILKKRYFKK